MLHFICVQSMLLFVWKVNEACFPVLILSVVRVTFGEGRKKVTISHLQCIPDEEKT
jgi:hypothetical protein